MRQKPSSHQSIDPPTPITRRIAGSAGSPNASVQRLDPVRPDHPLGQVSLYLLLTNVPGMQLVDRITARLALVGADPHDSEDLRAHKALLS
jgi:hypothetical protein